MSLRRILAIYGKELRDLVRDRRTLISTIVIPTVAMPLLLAAAGFASVSVVRKAASTPPAVAIVGGEDSPRVTAALRARSGLDARAPGGDWRRRIADKELRAAVEIPSGFDRALDRGEPAEVRIHHHAGELRSDFAVAELRRFLTEYGESIVVGRLKERGLPAASLRPFEVKTQNAAPPAKVGGSVVGGIVPYFFLLLCFTGAMYPAADLTAGEKERGTLETLLSSAATRLELALGKFLTVLTASLGTVACSLVSLGVTFAVGGPLLARGMAGGRSAERMTAMMTLDPVGLLGVLALVVPMAALFSATLLAISLFAKSQKEAQSYTSPLIIIVLLPAVAALLPGVELDARLALVPILNVALVSKELVSGAWPWGHLALIFSSTCVYAAVALWATVRLFQREGVVLRT